MYIVSTHFMFGKLPYKTNQFFFVLIKLSIVVGAFYFIYNKLTTNETLTFDVFVLFLKEHNVFSTKNIIVLLFLTCLNWCFEVLKWQNLVSVIKHISFNEALKQSLASLTASLFTPNRIGEYGVKAVCFSKGLRKRVLLLNLLSNITQMSATLMFGVVGFTIFYLKYDTNISLYKITRFIVLIFVVGGFVLLGRKYSKFQVRGFSIEKIINFLLEIPKSIHVKNITLSFLRYLVFSFQFYFLLKIFGIDVYYFNAMVVISSMYLISSIIPAILILDVVVKGSIALFLFGIVGVNSHTILSIVLLMWILNFAIPSIIGSAFILNYNYKEIKL